VASTRKKSKPRTLSNHSKPTKLRPRSAGNVDIKMGRRIRSRRVEIGLSLSELGEKLGVSFRQVQKYEMGVNRVGAARLQRIAAALGVDVTFFYGGKGKELEVESLLFLDSNFSLRLLRAYTAIKLTMAIRCPRGSDQSSRDAIDIGRSPVPFSSLNRPFTVSFVRTPRGKNLRPQLACSRSMSRVI